MKAHRLRSPVRRIENAFAHLADTAGLHMPEVATDDVHVPSLLSALAVLQGAIAEIEALVELERLVRP